MRKLTIGLLIALFTFLLGVAATLVYLTSGVNEPQKQYVASDAQERQELQLVIPHDIWEPIFFRRINERTREANLPSLRTLLLPADDLEVRIWFVVDHLGLDGIVLQRSADRWSATYLHGASKDPHFQKYQEPLSTPQSGWEATWEKLVREGLLRLPDASEIQCKAHALDGVGYVVEINMNKTYRTYMYDNPQWVHCDEGKQMMKIAEIIADEFNLEGFTVRK